jgi:Gram-negative bacterial TonB protein C-terminal
MVVRDGPFEDNHEHGRLNMIRRSAVLQCFIFGISVLLTAQSSGPELVSANIPTYPVLACMAKVEGVVKLSFTLAGNSDEPSQVEVLSGHPLFKAAAIENVKTWRFRNPYTVDRKYETTFTYRLSGRELPAGETKKLTVSLESFSSVEIITDAYQPTTTYGASPSTGSR